MSTVDNSVIWQCKTLAELELKATLELADDQIIGYRTFADSASLTADTPQDVWSAGGTKTRLTTAYTMSVVSASANDTVAGTGARYVLVEGLDSDYNKVSEVVTMNGATPVVTTQTFLRVYRTRVVLSGSGFTNAGVITTTSSTGGSTQSHIPAGFGISHASHFTIPAGYTGYYVKQVFSVYRNSGAASQSREVQFDLMLYSPASNTVYNSTTYALNNVGSSLMMVEPRFSSPLPEKSDIWVRATADVSNTTSAVSQEILLVKGNYDLHSYI